MWICPDKYKRKVVNVNEELSHLKGTLLDKEAKITLARFLKANIGLTTELISGIKLAPYQEIAIKGMMQGNFSMLVWGRGLSKCQKYSKETQLLTKELGLVSITELLPKVDFSKEEHWFNIGPFHFWNGREWQLVTKSLTQPKIETLKIKTRFGYSVSGSDRHLVKSVNTDNGNCNIVWKKLSDLKEGDYVSISRNISRWGENSDLEEAYLLGLLVGDGCYSQTINHIKFTTADRELLDFVKKFPTGIELKTNSRAIDINLKTIFSKELLDRYDIKRSLSYDKEIPRKILSSSFALKEFLSGLFDTDGCVYTCGGIGFSTTSKLLAEQVHRALSLFGVISRLQERKTKSKFGKVWIINVFGKNTLAFQENIGFRLTRKKEKLKEILNKKLNSNVDVVPGAKKACHKIKSNYRFPKKISDEWRSSIRRRDNQKELTYESLRKHLDFFKKAGVLDYDLQYLNEILEENFFFDKIINIEGSKDDCLDFNVPDGERYWCNGFINHNTFCASVFCFLQCIFEPGTRILIAGPTFRTARNIFNTIEKFSESKGAELLFQCFGAKSKRGDEFTCDINEGSIKAIPLNGEKIRGFRANVLVLDEFLLLPEDLIKNVLMPFLVAPQNIKERMQVREIEDKLIKDGDMNESDRMVFENNSKMVALSSASYTFENLYRTYQEWTARAFDESESEARYFVSQMGYEAAPPDMIDKTIIEEAQNGGSSNSSFLREYCAQFTDGSDSYYSFKKMEECTLKDERPHTLVKGAIGKKYILAIDPNMNESPSADYFAMSVMELDEENKQGILVNCYAGLGSLSNHVKYLHYLLTNFNIVMIILDNAGSDTFIDTYNNSEFIKKETDKIKTFDFNSIAEGMDYELQLRNARAKYNQESRCIAFPQVFESEFIRRANEKLQGDIDYKRVWFGSSTCGNEEFFYESSAVKVPLELLLPESKKDWSFIDILEEQDNLIYQTKKQCALVKFTTTARGNQGFELPQHLKRSSSPNRARKDNYTTLVLSNWLVRCYFDIMKSPEKTEEGFSPTMIY